MVHSVTKARDGIKICIIWVMFDLCSDSCYVCGTSDVACRALHGKCILTGLPGSIPFSVHIV